MNIELSEDVILGVLQQIEAAPRATSISSLTGDRPLNLLAVRELKRRGLITGSSSTTRLVREIKWVHFCTMRHGWSPYKPLSHRRCSMR